MCQKSCMIHSQKPHLENCPYEVKVFLAQCTACYNTQTCKFRRHNKLLWYTDNMTSPLTIQMGQLDATYQLFLAWIQLVLSMTHTHGGSFEDAGRGTTHMPDAVPLIKPIWQVFEVSEKPVNRTEISVHIIDNNAAAPQVLYDTGIMSLVQGSHEPSYVTCCASLASICTIAGIHWRPGGKSVHQQKW